MSIDLYTGTPGTGKSNHLVSQLLFTKKYDKRPIYHHGIEEFYTGTAIACRNNLCRTCRNIPMDVKAQMLFCEDLCDWQRAGDIIIIDEAQFPYPDRRSGSPPGYIQKLTESRHDGVDLIFITQNFAFIDVWVRKLVERTFHFVKGQTGRWLYTHTGCPTSDSGLLYGVKEKFTLDERAFGKYKSADVHTVVDHGLSRPQKILRLLLVGLAISSIIVLYLVYNSRDVVREINGPAPSADNGVLSTLSNASDAYRSIGRSTPSTGDPAPFRWDDPSILDARARVTDFPESAPAFDGYFSPAVIVPELAGCVSSKDKCKCYTPDALPYETSRAFCVAFSEGRASRFLSSGAAVRGRARAGAGGSPVP